MTIQKTMQKDSVLIGQLELYNRLWKEQDDIWQKAARKSGLPRTSYWILYTIVVTAPAPLVRQIFVKTGIFHVRP